MKITVVYDNNAEEGLNPGWGFSCLVEGDKNIIFDCGDRGIPLLENMKKLGIDPASIDIIVLSHDHWDHTGGITDLLRETGHIRVLVPASFSEKTKKIIRGKAEMIEIKGPQKISDKTYTTGELPGGEGYPKEQSFIIKTRKGLIVIVGCAHPGLKRIIKSAEKMGKIYMIMGGFHKFSDFGLLKEIDVLSPCHCTNYVKEIRETYPDNFREIKAGSVISV